MAKTATLCIKLDPTLKEEAEKVFQDIGISASSAVTMFYKQVVNKQGVPFELTAKRERKEPLDASKLTREQLIEEIKKGYRDIDEGRTIDAEEFFKQFDKEHNL